MQIEAIYMRRLHSMIKRLFAFASVLIIMICFGSCVSSQSSGKTKTVIKMATAFKQGHILSDASRKFKETVEVESKGSILVDLVEGVGKEEDINIECSKGIVDIQFTGGYPLEIFAPKYFFFNAPYVIKDYDHFLRVWNGELGKKAKDQVLKDGNMVFLGTAFRGLRQTTSKKPIKGPADIQGLKLRLPVVKTWLAVWKAVGAEPVPIPLTELYQSLKDGKADASEGDLPQIDSFKLSEVQSHLSITNHLVAIGWATYNSKAFEKLSDQDKKIVQNAMTKACDWATEKTKTNEGVLLAKLKTAGMTIITPDADAIRVKAKPAVEDLFKTEWPVTTWKEVLAQ
jgi:TRAP-type transport system periplasmic protein